jgi:site-specific DNA recombinase
VKAAGYVRVSTDEQVRDGWNLDEDKARIRELADREGWDLVEVYDDGGRQGDDFERPGLRSMLDSLGDLDVIVMRSIDRLSRDLLIYATVRNALRKARVTVYDFDGRAIEFDLGDDVKAVLGEEEKRAIGRRVKQARAGRIRNGLAPGGRPPYGYAWQDKEWVIGQREAAIVRRIFADYASGMGQRAIVRSLNDDGIRAPGGGRWHQGRVSRTLGAIAYIGKLNVEGSPDGKHEPIVDDQLWERVQAIKAGRSAGRKDGRGNGGRPAEGKHLLTRGLLRCRCGAAMIPRKARPGVEHERYVCGGRIADPRSCSQPSIRRDRIDAPLLATLLDRYIDIEAANRRVEERAASALDTATQAFEQAERELQRSEVRLARVRRGWQDEVIDDSEYAEQRAGLTVERDGAKGAVERARAHVGQLGQGLVPGDAEQVVLDHLARLKRAVGEDLEAAPDLSAIRNVIGDLFEQVELVESDDGSHLLLPLLRVERLGDERWDFEGAGRRQSLPVETLRPIGQATPVPSWQSYPPGFLARYCWW